MNKRTENLMNTIFAGTNTEFTNTYSTYTLKEIQDALEITKDQAVALVQKLTEEGIVKRRANRYSRISSVVQLRNVREVSLLSSNNNLLLAA